MELRQWINNQRDRALAIGVVVLGLIALALGWYGVSGEALPAGQLPYLASGGLLGIFALGTGATLWLSADLRDEWTKLEDLDHKLDSIIDELRSHTHEADSPGATNRPDATNGRASRSTAQRPLRSGR